MFQPVSPIRPAPAVISALLALYPLEAPATRAARHDVDRLAMAHKFYPVFRYLALTYAGADLARARAELRRDIRQCQRGLTLVSDTLADWGF